MPRVPYISASLKSGYVSVKRVHSLTGGLFPWGSSRIGAPYSSRWGPDLRDIIIFFNHLFMCACWAQGPEQPWLLASHPGRPCKSGPGSLGSSPRASPHLRPAFKAECCPPGHLFATLCHPSLKSSFYLPSTPISEPTLYSRTYFPGAFPGQTLL